MASALTDAQVNGFISHIGLDHFPQKGYSGNVVEDVRLLHQLHVHTISSIPYENLTIHYSLKHKIIIDPQITYKKIVEDKRGRGGYCMENSILLNHVLRGLGFTAYTAAVRIRYRVDGVPQGAYSGWVHIVNIVTLSDGSKYHLDVGFGGDGATAPIPLIENQPQHNLGTQEIRLIKDHIPVQTDRRPETKLWIYQYRNSPQAEWNSFYSFAEVEATEPDFYIMNWYTGSHPESFQTFTALIIRFLRHTKEDGSGDSEINGKIMLVNGLVKENLGGKTRIVQECKTESERIEALQRWFGITLTAEEKQAIVGWATELKA